MKEYRYGETVLRETDEEDEHGRVCLTRLLPGPVARDINGTQCYTLPDVARMMNKSKQMLYEREWAGKLDSLRVGSRVYLPLTVVTGLLQE